MSMIYKGNGAHIPGIPARDLDAYKVRDLAASYRMEIEDFENALIRGGLYERFEVTRVTDLPKRLTEEND